MPEVNVEPKALKIVIHDRPQYGVRKGHKAISTVFCWVYDPIDHTITRVVGHMNRLKNVKGILVEKSLNKIKQLMASKGIAS